MKVLCMFHASNVDISPRAVHALELPPPQFYQIVEAPTIQKAGDIFWIENEIDHRYALFPNRHAHLIPLPVDMPAPTDNLPP